VEADSFKKKAKALREQLEDREMEETRFRHEKELKELEEAHLAEMNLFQLEWNKQIADFNQEIEKALQELAERHEAQLVNLQPLREKRRATTNPNGNSMKVPNC
jgi:hypothetical protein